MPASNYRFPIFISSTHYDLIDLRAELSSHLSNLGYDPVVSSESGFPDNTPLLSPWESCLPVLSTCFMMVLIIDSKYGAKLKWDNYSELFKDEKLSPTHGEYRYAHANKIRLIIFIRKEMIAHYQSFKRLKDEGKSIEEITALLEQTLPKRIKVDTLKFIAEVKTTTPIPWIKEFEDVTEIKKEIQSKLTNELAEVFLLKEKHQETLIKKLNEFLGTKTNEEKVDILNQLNIKSNLLDQINSLKSKTSDLETKLQSISDAEDATAEKLKEEIEAKNKEIQKLIEECGNYELSPSDELGVVYAHTTEEHCHNCGCCGSYNCVDMDKGEIQHCTNCGSLTCINCLGSSPICPNCMKKVSEAIIAMPTE